MRWHKTQRSKNTPSSLQVNVPDSKWLPLTARRVLPGSTGPVARYLGPHLDIMGSIRPVLERRRAAAFRTWTRISPSVVSCRHPIACSAPFLPGLESLRLRSPDYEHLDRFILGLGRKMMRGKATIYYETGRWHRKKAHSRQKEGLGFSWPGTFCHGTARSSPFNGTRTL